MGLDRMRPTYNLEPKYRVTMLTRENWTRGSRAPPEVKGYGMVYRRVQDGGGDRGRCLWVNCEKEAQLSPG